MNATRTVRPASDARLVIQLAQKKSAEANRVGATTEPFGERVLCGLGLGALVFHSPNDVSVTFSYGDGRYNYELQVMTDGTLVEIYDGDPSQRPTFEDQIALADSLPVVPEENAPYGYIEDGRVITSLMYFEEEYRLACYVLEGAVMPAPLRMPHDVDHDGIVTWVGNFWKLVGDGRIVRLSSFIRELPYELESMCEPGGRGFLVYHADAPKTKGLVLGQRYFNWHPRELFAGELFNESQSDVPYRASLRYWFN